MKKQMSLTAWIVPAAALTLVLLVALNRISLPVTHADTSAAPSGEVASSAPASPSPAPTPGASPVSPSEEPTPTLAAEPAPALPAGQPLLLESPSSLDEVLLFLDAAASLAQESSEAFPVSITLTADLSISQTIPVPSRVQLSVASEGGVRALRRAEGFTGAFFHVQSEDAQLSIQNLALDGGEVPGCASLIINHGSTRLGKRSYLSGNHAPVGGAVKNHGTLGLSGASITHCSAQSGGAIYNAEPGSVHIAESSLISDCTALEGGAVYSQGQLAMDGATLSGNQAGMGGGIYAQSGSLSLVSASVSGNLSTQGLGHDLLCFDEAQLTLEAGTVGSEQGGLLLATNTQTILPAAFDLAPSSGGQLSLHLEHPAYASFVQGNYALLPHELGGKAIAVAGAVDGALSQDILSCITVSDGLSLVLEDGKLLMQGGEALPATDEEELPEATEPTPATDAPTHTEEAATPTTAPTATPAPTPAQESPAPTSLLDTDLGDAGVYRVSCPKLTVRGAPSNDGRRLGSLKEGDLVIVGGIKGGWATIVYEGETAYVYSGLIEKTTLTNDDINALEN